MNHENKVVQWIKGEDYHQKDGEDWKKRNKQPWHDLEKAKGWYFIKVFHDENFKFWRFKNFHESIFKLNEAESLKVLARKSIAFS